MGNISQKPPIFSAVKVNGKRAYQLARKNEKFEINSKKIQIIKFELLRFINKNKAQFLVSCGPGTYVRSLARDLSKKLGNLLGNDDLLKELNKQLSQVHKTYIDAAEKLTKKRNIAIKNFKKSVNDKLQNLKMDQCIFDIEILKNETKSPNINGEENIEFLISTIPKKPPQSISQIASGGELSRISLAIAVVIAQTSKIPTLVFDEVDVGIGGAVAEVVGNLLRELSNNGQALCVTHLAQVAAKGKNHFLATKNINKKDVTTNIQLLNKEGRALELARMLGGLDITESSVAHAVEMLETA